MRVIVLGAGLAGVTSAWYLRQAGHAVTVIDRQPAAGLETSYANGGQISVSHPEPWANPGAPAQVLRWLGHEDAPLLFRPRLDWSQWSWGMRFLLECLPGRTRRNTAAVARLAVHSRDCLRMLRADTGIEYDRIEKGILHLFFDPREFARTGKRAALLARFGIRAEVHDAPGCRAIEPALAHCRDTLQGGLHAPDDETGDALLFTQRLAGLCRQAGVEFRYGRRIVALAAGAQRVTAAALEGERGAREEVGGDAFLVALGSHSAALARGCGDVLQIYPVKGYSVTLPLAAGSEAPSVSITDEAHRIVCSRLGDRLRIAGTAELTGFDASVNTVRCAAILRRARQLFPRIEAAGAAEYWAGLRPATPGNVPIIGRGRPDNLFYNTGHGTLGWTLACGSGQAIADIMGGSRPRVEFPFSRL
ncbi:MAG: D-amino acid dehydrogenase [Zoogloeaceae bacterium]|nr:D-amino acid dehydrogenase [Zoogloeaceae bacterium]MCK6384632.1 D-amino acid dehydrogenase [Rhodocyclaceae bacterium]